MRDSTKISIPQFAANLFEKQQAVIKEKEEMKRLVLTHEQRQEEEELLVRINVLFFRILALSLNGIFG